MLRKLRVEAGTYDFARRAFLWLVLGAVAGGGYFNSFAESGLSDRWEFAVFVLTDPLFGLLFLPTLLLALTSARAEEARRYPVLLRYRNRGEALMARLIARAFFALFMVLSLVGMLGAIQVGMQRVMQGVMGRGLPVRGNIYPEVESITRLLVCLCMNITCFLFSLLVLQEVLQRVFHNMALELFFTFLVPVLNWIAVMNGMTPWMYLWSPWGRIVYLSGTVYRFFWQYWLGVLAVLLCVAVWLEKNRDYVFEQHRRSG
ncbi:MAG: hypothetical protein J1E03_09555 [Acetatifactor sp.]|nr:hypothetical protein [Acetatifactor sp.]